MEFNRHPADAIIGGWELERMAALERVRTGGQPAGGSSETVAKPQAPRYYEDAAVAGGLTMQQFVMGGELVNG